MYRALPCRQLGSLGADFHHSIQPLLEAAVRRGGMLPITHVVRRIQAKMGLVRPGISAKMGLARPGIQAQLGLVPPVRRVPSDLGIAAVVDVRSWPAVPAGKTVGK
jgi:hypothetical protein